MGRCIADEATGVALMTYKTRCRLLSLMLSQYSKRI